jgi:trk system potassium uptake protein TrkH
MKINYNQIRRKRRTLTTTRVIMLGFLVGAVIGALCLMLPVSLRRGVKLKFIDALFTAVSAICVTGLSTVNIGQTYSAFGQLILLFLIQLGGLGVVTFTTLVLIALRKRITLSERMLIQNAYNLETLSGLVKLTARITKVTLCIEGIGAVGYSIVFVPEYGVKGVWYGIFHAVSAFCNAGIDLLGGNSFTAYRDNILLNLTTIFLIIISGLGFPVYWEIARAFNERRAEKGKGYLRKLNVHSRIVLVATAVLVAAGTVFTLVFEHDNTATLGTMNGFQKVMAALFQSVTLRTAGFATIDQSGFKNATCFVYIVLMFIGGSPAGTAGGVKTVTIVLLFASMIANIRGRRDVTVMHRRIADDYIRRCVAIVTFSLSTLIILTVALLYVQDAGFMDTVYEMTSAIATVGLSRGLTGELKNAGKIIVCMAMYLGRIGPITLALGFNSKRAAADVTYADSRVIIG